MKRERKKDLFLAGTEKLIAPAILGKMTEHLFVSFLIAGVLPLYLSEWYMKGWQLMTERFFRDLFYNLLLSVVFFLGVLIFLLLIAAIEIPAEATVRLLFWDGEEL